MTGASAAGDRPLVAQPAQPMDPRRALGALGSAIDAEVWRANRAGTRVGAALVLGVAVILWLLGRSVPALAWLDHLPWFIPTVLIVAAGAIAVAAMPMLMLPRRFLDAWVAYAFLAIDARVAWRRSTGEPFPEAPDAVERWLARDPGEHRLMRASLLLGQGRPREAGDILAAVEPADQAEAFLHAQLSWLAAFMSDRDDPALFEHLRAAAVAFGTAGRARQVADASVEMLVAVRTVALEGDWIEPLVRARRSLGDLARDVAFRHMFLPRLRHYGTVAALVGVGLIAVQISLGSP